MNDNLDIDAVLSDWRDKAPPKGFSNRVLAALDGKTRPWKSWLVAAAACTCVLFAAVLYVGTYETAANSAIATAQEPDLGLQRD